MSKEQNLSDFLPESLKATMSDKSELEKRLDDANQKVAYLQREIVHVLCSMDDSPDSIEAVKNHLRHLANR